MAKDDSLIEPLLRKVATGGLTQKELVAAYQNTLRTDAISDEARERLVSAVELQLRERFPRSAKKMFGPVDEQARGLLTNLQQQIAERFDLSKNAVGNHVKTGGEVIAGRYEVDVYISYKNSLGQRASLDVRQEKTTDKPAARVQLVQVGGKEAGTVFVKSYELEAFDEAARDYLKQLESVLAR